MAKYKKSWIMKHPSANTSSYRTKDNQKLPPKDNLHERP